MRERTLTSLVGSNDANSPRIGAPHSAWPLYPAIPSAEERHRVAAYLRKMGYSDAELAEFDCLGREYELAKKAMLFSELNP